MTMYLRLSLKNLMIKCEEQRKDVFEQILHGMADMCSLGDLRRGVPLCASLADVPTYM